MPGCTSPRWSSGATCRATALKLVGEPVGIGRGRTISGELEIRGVELADDVQLGGYRLQRPFVALHPSFPVGNLGGVVLSRFVLTFDQHRKLLRLEAPERILVLPRPLQRRVAGPPDAGASPAR